MTHSEFLSHIKSPESIGAEHITDLRTMVETYPYFTAARVLLARALKKTDSLHYSYVAQQTALYTFDRRWLYFFLYPEKLQQSTTKHTQNQKKTSSGDYFDMLERIENQGGDTNNSLRQLAAKLKAAREFSVAPEKNNDKKKEKTKIENYLPIEEYNIEENAVNQSFVEGKDWEEKEKKAKKLIVEKNFPAALAILREINLNNPKKSVYFADQIRFLEKIIENSKN